MSISSGPTPSGFGSPGSGTLTDIVTQLNGIARMMSNWVQAWTNKSVFGSFTLTASASTVVAQPGVAANSFISLTPTNAAAAQSEGSTKKLYLSSINPGVSFTVATGSGVAAAGTETFQYEVSNPQ